MAEDDDDEAFGDFAFAPFQSNSLINGLNSSPPKAEEDDDWGDFLQPPLESKPSETATNGDHRSDNSVSLTTWKKPSGALPLSIFGGAEEEEEVPNDLVVSVDLNPGKSYKLAEGFSSVLAGNGVSNPEKFSIADLYDRYLQIKPESRAGSDFAGKVVSVENGVHAGANNNAAESAFPELKNMDFSNALVVRDPNQPTNKSSNEDFSFNFNMSDPSKKDDIFGGWTGDFTGFTSNLKTSPENVLTLSSDLDTNGQKQQSNVSAIDIDDNDGVDDDNDDDDEWDFKDANSEVPIQHVNSNADFMVHEVSHSNPYSSGTRNGSMQSLDLFGTSNGSIDLFASSTEPVDYFANSSGVSTTFQEMDLIGVQPSSDTVNGFSSGQLLVVEQNHVLDQRTNVGVEELEKDFGEFSAASAETRPETNEPFTNIGLPPIQDIQTRDDEIKENDTKQNHRKGAIPLSIFGDVSPESGSSSDVPDFFVHKPVASERSDRTAGPVTSIHDMISNLYSQAEQTSSTKTMHNITGAQLDSSSVVSSSSLVDDDGDGDDDEDDGSWDFKDASQIVDSEASLSSMGDAYRSMSSKLKVNSHLEFYLKLKEELCFVLKNHIDRLKNAGGDAALFGEGGGASSFDREFQLVCDEMNFEGGALQDHHTRDSHLHEFAQILLEPLFQKLESEYHLSQKLLLVEKDLGSSMELMRHINAMLKILKIGTPEEQMFYVSLWHEIISVCAQELRHGAWIWNEAVAKRVQSQLLSEPQGRNFVLALGEIYRLVVVLGASAELFKPWILSGSVDSPSIYMLIEECRLVWSTSELEEALSSVLAPTSLDDASLFKSIKHILSLDELELENYVFSEKESRCCLSLLTAGVVPDLKIVMWGDEECFITLANLWSNLISRNLPKLPRLNFGR